MTELLDLSVFKSGEKDNTEDLASLVSKQTRRIGEGSHEVTVVRINQKENGQNIEMSQLAGGSVTFSLVVSNSKHEEQLIMLSIPLAQSFKQACSDSDMKVSARFRITLQNLFAMGIEPILLRESIIDSNGKSVESLVGSQFLLINSWPADKLHLEYDTDEKGYYFTTSIGERFESGELSAIIKLDPKAPFKDRYSIAIAVATEHGYKLALQMYSNIETLPTVNNDNINEALRKHIKTTKTTPISIPKPTATGLVNKTAKPTFPGLVKKIQVPLDTPEDVGF